MSTIKLWSWGSNNTGQLGHGFSSEQISLPKELTTPSTCGLDDLVAHQEEDDNGSDTNHEGAGRRLPSSGLGISSGGSHAIIIGNLHKRNELVYRFHHLGLISTKYECPKIQILLRPTNHASTTRIVEKVRSGWEFNLFLNGVGEVYSQGCNTYGQLGRPILQSASSDRHFDPYWGGISLQSLRINSISTGMRHAAALSDSKCLVTWGDNSKGQTGLGVDTKIISEPTRVGDLDFIPSIIGCSKAATIILAQDGYFYGAGLNKFGMFGEQLPSSRTIHPTFTRIFCLEDTMGSAISSAIGELKVKDFQCGWNHVLVLLENGELISWGRNNFYQLGRKVSTISDVQHDATPGYVEGISERIQSIACGSEHNMACGVSGQVYTWGWNEHDNCGIVQPDQRLEFIETPTQVVLPESEEVISVQCGGGNCYVVTRPRRHQITVNQDNQ